jgi:hypothetical protein
MDVLATGVRFLLQRISYFVFVFLSLRFRFLFSVFVCGGKKSEAVFILYWLLKVIGLTPSLDPFVELVDKLGCRRPGLRTLFSTLLRLRKVWSGSPTSLVLFFLHFLFFQKEKST